MKNSALPYWLTFAVILAAIYGGFKLYQVESFRADVGGVSAIKLPPLENFELTDQQGRPFRSADMKGKVWVVSFFYSTCPFSCSRLNSNIKYLTTREELADVTWVSITVDPATDTQAVLKKYAKQHNADEHRWRFCRHDDFEYVKRLADDVLHVGGVNYQGHNDYVVVIDQAGEIKGMYNGYEPASLEKAVALIKELLAEQPALADGGAEAP